MGRTLPTVTQAFQQEQQSLARFRRALRREDQVALDELMADARRHVAEAAYASHLLPFEVMLLAMLVEERKWTQDLERRVEALEAQLAELPAPSAER
ncbi:MAG: hypothetical protein ACLFWD_00735 [Anaerolineales bacterium]